MSSDHYYDGADFGDTWCDYNGYDPDNIRWCCHQHDDYPVSKLMAQPAQDNPGYTEPDVWGSPHFGMCNMAFCDGSVHQINYGISTTVNMYLSDRNDGVGLDASQF